ncbi:MAG: enoyl-CoA hydratase/isomerase family protein [Burkholderiales bacterium]|nr:enoyl-CoA hydratase/isomerase family protein [Burkholderiales bacterium]
MSLTLRKTYETLRVEARSPGVACVTMARPAVFNAFDEAMIGELDDAIAALEADAGVRVIVLAGEGRHFSAGADLQWMQRASQATLEWNVADARRFASMLGRLEACPKPTVARVQGAALGGGVGLVAACDIAIASDNASFTVSEAKFGILPAVIGPYVTNAIGKRQARRLALTTERIGATEALEMGLVQRVVVAEQLDAAIDELVHGLLAGGPNAHREIKQLFAQLHQGPITAEVRELTAQTIARVRGTDEAREGFAAFLGKRPAAWIPPAGGKA